MNTKGMNKKGFTLIELLIVVVIIGILAAIAIPRFSATRERAFVSTMQSDLRNLLTIQEQYYADPGTTPVYTYGSNAAIQEGTPPLFASSNAVTIVISGEGSDGFAAVANHEGVAVTCAVYVGTATAVAPATTATASGEIVCSDTPAP
ncbi:hypothetical protein BH23VER1_BH23VER1_37610 [soil metagenome]